VALLLESDLRSYQLRKARNIVGTSVKINLLMEVTTTITIGNFITAGVIFSFKFVLPGIFTKEAWINLKFPQVVWFIFNSSLKISQIKHFLLFQKSFLQVS